MVVNGTRIVSKNRTDSRRSNQLWLDKFDEVDFITKSLLG